MNLAQVNLNHFNPKGLANPGKMFPTPRTCGERANAQKQAINKNAELY